MKKVIFLDVDGTLVDYKGNLPSSAVNAIQQARKNGHLVYICTGRSKAEVYDELWNISLDGMIGGNGAYVESQGEVIMHQHYSEQQCKDVVDWLGNRGIEFFLECNSGLYGSKDFEEQAKPFVQQYALGKGETDAMSWDTRTAFPEMIFGENLYRDDVNKISFLLHNYQDYVDAKDKFQDLKAGTWGGVGETALFGDLGVKDIDKGVAIHRLLDHLHMSLEDTIAFGDAKVDIPMITLCKIGVAMGNGGEEIKQAADYITDAVEEDGLYHAFKHFNLI